jgi:diacylglycerol kinase (ATP)
MKKNLLFIINPISGTRQKKSIPGEIERYLNHDFYDYRIAYTERAGHASQLAKEAAEEGVDIVVAVGGDGTINEVARSLVHTRAALAIIPCGSGNGLARHLQIPTNPKGALEIINKGVVHCLDYGRLNGRPFFCTCGVGFDAFVSEKFAESGKRGLLQYAKNTIGIGLTYKPERYTISYDGQTETSEAFLITCANASQYGNNAFIAPTASMKDGLMDIIIMRPFPTITGGVVLLQMFTKNLLSNAHVDLLRTSHIHISREKEGAVHCDGDPIKMGRELDIDLERRGINIVVNPEAHTQRRNYLVEVGEQIGHLFDGSLSLIPTGKRVRTSPPTSSTSTASSKFRRTPTKTFWERYAP